MKTNETNWTDLDAGFLRIVRNGEKLLTPFATRSINGFCCCCCCFYRYNGCLSETFHLTVQCVILHLINCRRQSPIPIIRRINAFSFRIILQPWRAERAEIFFKISSEEGIYNLFTNEFYDSPLAPFHKSPCAPLTNLSLIHI